MIDDVALLAQQLDEVYQQALTRLAQQTRDSILIDQALRRLLDQTSEDASVLQWDPERAMPPHSAFRSLALKLIERAHALTSNEFPLLETHYADLLSWSAEPKRYDLSPADQFLARIAFAREQTLSSFWEKLKTRLSPQSNPYRSERNAVVDLVQCFGTEVPEAVLLPKLSFPSTTALVLKLPRAFKEHPFSMSPSNAERLNCAVQSVSTLLLLARHQKAATGLNEGMGMLSGKLRGNFSQYAHKDTYYCGLTGSMVLFEDHIQLRIHHELFEDIRASVTRHTHNPQWVDAHLTEYLPLEIEP